MQQIRIAAQTKSTPFLEHFRICKFNLVHEIDATWNPIYGSILVMYKKLRDLGFVYRDGEIVIESLEA